MAESAHETRLPSTALILVDVINSFFLEGMPNYYSEAVEALEPLRRLQAKARETGKLIVHTVERHYPGFDDYERTKLPRHHFIGDADAVFFKSFRARGPPRDRVPETPL
jgi:maleamate amidohydrolase